jgi:hypothetical protein
MALLGQASGGFTESSSALRILHVGVRNTVGILTDDAFTQTNPPIVTDTSTISESAGMDTATLGVLSGSVAFARGDVGSNYIGGAVAVGVSDYLLNPLGLFINTAVGNAYENTPGVASGKGPYVSSQGTYGNSLYETQSQAGAGAYTKGDDLTYTTGMALMASLNGYLQPAQDAAGTTLVGTVDDIVGQSSSIGGSILGILKMPADSTQPEIVFDQRI